MYTKEVDIWKELLDYARWTPSPHNVQPWLVKIISESEAQIYYDPKRLLPVEDDTGCFTTLAFGIFIEYLSIAAAKYGLKVQEEYHGALLDANKPSATFFATIILTPAKDTLFDRELIKQRRTSRLPYFDKLIDPEIMERLQKVTQSFGYTFNFSNDPEIVDWVLQLNCDTLFYDMTDTATRREVGSWIRYSKQEAFTKKDGLWAYCMNIPALFMYLAFHIPQLFNNPLLTPLLKKRYLQTTQGTKTVAWLSGPFNNPQDWLRAGHMMAHLWLTMTQYNIYLHPFGSIITNHKSHQRFVEKFKVNEQTNPIWLLVRLGQSDLPPRSVRVAVEELLLP